MNRHDYLAELKDCLADNGYDEIIREKGFDEAYDEAFLDDCITGNASGSFTFNSYEAMENIFGAEDVIEELVNEYGLDSETVTSHLTDYEYWDVSIRCYLLNEAMMDFAGHLDYDDDFDDNIFADEDEFEEAEEE